MNSHACYCSCPVQMPVIYTLAELEGVTEEIDPAGTNITATGACMAQIS